MNSIVLVGYISNIEYKKDENTGLYQVKFSICDNVSNESCMWFNCYLKTLKDSTIEFIKKGKAEKRHFTIIGSMFYNYSADKERTYINVSVKNLM